MKNTKEKDINNNVGTNKAPQVEKQSIQQTQQAQPTEQNQYEEQENTMPERKGIVYLIILTVILIFIALFFIYDIIDRGTINTSETAPVTFPDNQIDVIDGTDGNNAVDVIDGDASIKIFEGTKEWSELKELNIFDREHMHVVNGKIAPGVVDKYVYTVECYGDYSMLYNMKFSDENPHKINMKYKLRRNGTYVAGDENTWVTVEQLSQEGMKIAPGTIDVFILDWKWEDADNDTEIGETEGAKYIINIKSDAEAIMQ